MKALTDDELKQVFGDRVPNPGPSIDWEDYWKSVAQFELLGRELFAQAIPVLERPGSSGYYCVMHRCDGKDCADKHA